MLKQPVQIGAYRVIRELARGGMGILYQCWDEQFERKLAVKVIRPNLTGNHEAILRFRRESITNGVLQHPSIPPVHAMGDTEDGRPYFAMKLIEGRTLTKVMADDQVAVGRLLDIFRQVAEAVACAHSQRIVHRDLKPENVMVGEFGEVQVIDWGMAKAVDASSASGSRATGTEKTIILGSAGSTTETTAEDSDRLSSLEPGTQFGQILGTPAYMSPEQARGQVEQIDERTDVFALGAVLFELLTGDRLYSGESAEEVLRLAADADTSLAFEALNRKEIDEGLISIIADATRANRDDRPPNAGEVARRIAAYQSQLTERLRAAELQKAAAEAELRVEIRRRRLARWLTALLVLFLLGGAAVATQLGYQSAVEAARQRAHDGTIDSAVRSSEEILASVKADLTSEEQWRSLSSNPAPWDTRLAQLQAHLSTIESLYEGESRRPDERLTELSARLRAARRDRRWAGQIDAVRSRAAMLVNGEFVPNRRLADGYAEFFSREFDYRIGSPPAKIVERLRRSHLALGLRDAVLNWAGALHAMGKPKEVRQLVALLTAKPFLATQRNANLVDVRIWDQPAALRKIAAAEDSSVSLVLFASQRLRAAGDRAGAQEVLRNATRITRDDFWLWLIRGDFEDNPQEQLRCYQAALAVRPTASAALVNRGHALRKLKKLRTALESFRLAIRYDNADWVAHQGLAVTHFELGELDEAEKILRSVLTMPGAEIGGVNSNLGGVLLLKGEFDTARSCYKDAIRVRPDLWSAHHGLGASYLAEKRPVQALRSLEAAREADSSQAKIYHDTALAKEMRSDRKGAIDAFRHALKYDPHRADTHYNLGRLQFLDRDFAAADRSYQKAISIDPGYLKALDALALLKQATGDFEAAEALFRKCIQLDDKDVGIRVSLGVVLQRRGKLAAAKAAFEAVISAEVNHAEALFNLGVVELLLKNYALAEGRLARALPRLGTGTRMSHACTRLLANARAYQRLNTALARFQKKHQTPRTPVETALLAQFALRERKDATIALKLFEIAFAASPKLLASSTNGHRISAAAAAVAIAKLSNETKARQLRSLARRFLTADLDVIQTLPDSEKEQALRQWYGDPFLAPVRNPMALHNLDLPERIEWMKLWDRVSKPQHE